MGLSNNRDPAFRERLQAALAIAGGDSAAGARYQQLALQRQDNAREQQAADRAVQQRDDQIWGAKESGVSNPLIATMTPGDLSQLQRERYAPFTGSPGSRHVMPSLNGGADTVDATPTTTEQEARFLGTVDPALAQSYLAKQALTVVNGTDEQGRPTIQAIDPRTLFNFRQPTGTQAPSPSPLAPPAPASASPPTAPAFSGNAPLTVDDVSGRYASDNPNTPQYEAPRPLDTGGPSFRGVQFGNPLANMPRIRNAPRRSAPQQGTPLVRNTADYNRLRRGQQYRLPDGRIMRKR